jgi:hypothetical protein
MAVAAIVDRIDRAVSPGRLRIVRIDDAFEALESLKLAQCDRTAR